MLNTAQHGSFCGSQRPEIIRHRDWLNGVTDAYVRRHGFPFLKDPDSPAFMRRLCGVAVEWPHNPALIPETPGPVTCLLETLFSCVLGDAFPLEETAGIRTCQ